MFSGAGKNRGARREPYRPSKGRARPCTCEACDREATLDLAFIKSGLVIVVALAALIALIR